MSKIGKKYNLSSFVTQTGKNFKDFLSEASARRVEIYNFSENYNAQEKKYVGEIVFTGEAQHLLDLEQYSKRFIGRYVNTNFSVDTHYEELIEIKTQKIATGISGSLVNLSDSVDLLKYNNLLEYNFLVRNYENFLNSNPSIQETSLPYFYEVLSDFVSGQNFQGFEGTSFFENVSGFVTQKYREELKTNIIPSEVIVEDKDLRIDKYLEKFNIYKEQFPFYADILFNTHELDEKSITEILQRKKLYLQMMETVLSQSSDGILKVASSLQNSPTEINVKEFDIKDFLYNQSQILAGTDFTFIFDINQRIDNKARTFLEVVNNQQEYSEVIGYHLKKYTGNTSDLLQEWYLPNVGVEQLSWIDSQIRYNKLYTYKLDPIILTFATEYEIKSSEMRHNRLIIKFVNKPLIKVYILGNARDNNTATIGATYTNKLLDYPPMEPELELIPYIGIDNKIKINLNTSTGKKTVPAINFNSNEEAKKDELRIAQNKDTNSDLLTFQTDEPADFMQLYRTDVKPKSYNDFTNKNITSLSTNKSAGASFVDSIEPNKKYYYVARCIDYHQNISNPTVIYELEILNDNGLIVPFIKVVDFDKNENNKVEIKSFKRYVKITPALTHKLVNTQKTSENNIQLGNLDITPWNKKFKLRLTSKSTGKKIDVNFTFKYNKPQ